MSNRTPINKRICLGIMLILFCVGCGRQAAAGADTSQGKDVREPSNNPFGVLEFLHWDYAWSNYKYAKNEDLEKAVQLMQEAGVGIVRMDFLWQDIEPEQGKFNFAKYDHIVDLLSSNKIEILGLLDYSVPWASGNGLWNYSPKDNRLFVNYAVQVIQRYKHKIKYWEVWNEPDSPVYWSNQDGLAGYCALLKDVYAAAKNADPAAQILNGGLAGGLASVNRLYDNGAGKYFDILNIHYFDTPLRPGAIKAVMAYPQLAHKVMMRHGDTGKKIWITEIGCPGISKGAAARNWWLGENPDEVQQAVWLREVYTALLQDKNVEKVFWAFFRDCQGHWGDGVDHFGLVRWDFSKKAAFGAYEECFKKWEKKE